MSREGTREGGDGRTAGGWPSNRARVRRLPDRGRYERSVVDAILDEGFVCHLGFAVDGQPWVVPTSYTRRGDLLYLHGAPANHALRSMAAGIPACVTVTLVDGLVLSRAAFHHSVNYRSVMVFGVAAEVTDEHEKRVALEAVVEHVVPGRRDDTRPPTPAELRGTRVLRLPIDETSAKVRSGGPNEDPGDLDSPFWGGEIPLRTAPGPPVPDPHVPSDRLPPAYALHYARPR